MPQIVMVSGKGGTGKTTLAFGIALTLNEAGKTFTIINHDPQKSLTALLNQLPLPARRQPPAAVTIVDTPPRLDDASVRAVIKTADVLLVPTDSSPMDVPVTNNTAKLVESLRKETANAFVVLNKVRKRTFWNRQAEENPNAGSKTSTWRDQGRPKTPLPKRPPDPGTLPGWARLGQGRRPRRRENGVRDKSLSAKAPRQTRAHESPIREVRVLQSLQGTWIPYTSRSSLTCVPAMGPSRCPSRARIACLRSPYAWLRS
jgi:hypothetical protein